MKKVILLLTVLLMVACAGLPTAPSPTPDEHAILKTYLEEARALIDKDREVSDKVFKEVGICDTFDEDGNVAVQSMECRRAWQEYAIRYRPLLLEFQSQWKALNPPPMAQIYHAQMAVVIENKVERNLTMQIAPIGSEDAFNEMLFGDSDGLLLELRIEAEAQRKFKTLWKIATEGE